MSSAMLCISGAFFRSIRLSQPGGAGGYAEAVCFDAVRTPGSLLWKAPFC